MVSHFLSRCLAFTDPSTVTDDSSEAKLANSPSDDAPEEPASIIGLPKPKDNTGKTLQEIDEEEEAELEKERKAMMHEG